VLGDEAGVRIDCTASGSADDQPDRACIGLREGKPRRKACQYNARRNVRLSTFISLATG
jgi:hypothetical protein